MGHFRSKCSALIYRRHRPNALRTPFQPPLRLLVNAAGRKRRRNYKRLRNKFQKDSGWDSCHILL
ncbi:hypothetical protein NECAME_09001 [Necator americanus]|uniref:Uncharacterized protein n=1 Tax=Necator americanus TaxID=51031 RepID=W2TGJ4_NECAM|nr:hypothetical protein NECAME_09001 [Necator americanus]ETN80719.1 hypothetical protein NECAME_09001 [Necator americanus]